MSVSAALMEILILGALLRNDPDYEIYATIDNRSGVIATNEGMLLQAIKQRLSVFS